MDILKTKVATKKFIDIILRAERASSDELRLLRQELIEKLEKSGPKNFVSITADILKNNFHIEGCNDARTPLKKIFNISLEELKEALLNKDYGLAQSHPLSILAQDHRDNINKLKALNSSLNGTSIKEYFTELDLHIRKEEEVLFPVLEKDGMKEHPDNLKEEHKGFREILSHLIELTEKPSTDRFDLAVEKFRNKFVPDISNHIFRETYIFYPAALEFITDPNEWEVIKREFEIRG